MSKKGHYPGGHTIIRSGSDWFAGQKKKSCKQMRADEKNAELQKKCMRENCAARLARCLETGTEPLGLPRQIRDEIDQAGGIRAWLNCHFYGRYIHPDE